MGDWLCAGWRVDFAERHHVSTARNTPRNLAANPGGVRYDWASGIDGSSHEKMVTAVIAERQRKTVRCTKTIS